MTSTIVQLFLSYTCYSHFFLINLMIRTKFTNGKLLSIISLLNNEKKLRRTPIPLQIQNTNLSGCTRKTTCTLNPYLYGFFDPKVYKV